MTRDPRCEWLNEKLVRYRALSTRVLEKQLEKVCEAHGVSEKLCMGDYQFLAAVANAKEPNISMAQVARQLGVNPSSATRRNQRLLECGFVSKTSDAADERRYQIALTQQGRAFYEEMHTAIFGCIQAMFSTITEEEFEAVYAFTDKCNDNLQKILDT